VRPDDLGAAVLRGLLRSTSFDPSGIDDILWGCANQAGEDNRNIGRMSALLAGIPNTVPAATINRLCASSLDAVIHAARAIWSGDAHVLIAGGVESMSRAPYSLPKYPPVSVGGFKAYDTALGWRYPNPKMEELFPLESMGETAENVAEQFGIGREEQDAFALESHRKAVRATSDGVFADEILPIDLPAVKGTARRVAEDEGPRKDTSMEKLSSLRPVFREDGTVTAGNSSPLNDGAAALLLMERERADTLGLTPLARVVSTGVAGVDPRFMGIGPVPATRLALKKAGMTIDAIGLVELNEAFASQALAVMRDLSLHPERVNVNGGAIALGHPLGCSGARILVTLVRAMQRRRVRFGLATMCVGVGQGVAVIVEREPSMND
jgi:3-oxoadipyl-CoA thiolase